MSIVSLISDLLSQRKFFYIAASEYASEKKMSVARCCASTKEQG